MGQLVGQVVRFCSLLAFSLFARAPFAKFELLYIHTYMYVHKYIKKNQTGMCGCSRISQVHTHTHFQTYMCVCVPILLDAAAAHKRANFSVSVSFDCMCVPLCVCVCFCGGLWPQLELSLVRSFRSAPSN